MSRIKHGYKGMVRDEAVSLIRGQILESFVCHIKSYKHES